MTQHDEALVAEIVKQIETHVKPGKFDFRSAGSLLPDTRTIANGIFFRDQKTLFRTIEAVRDAMLLRMNDPRAPLPFSRDSEKLIGNTLKRMVAAGVSRKAKVKTEIKKAKKKLEHPGGIAHLKALSLLLIREPGTVQRLDATTARLFSNAIGGKSTDPLSRELGEYLRTMGIARRVESAVVENLRRPIPLTQTEAITLSRRADQDRKRAIGFSQSPGPRPTRKGKGRRRF